MLEGKVAIVTGGSRGIGKAIALKLAEQGADVIVNYVSSEQPALEVVAQIEKMGRKASAIKCDVSSFEQTELLMKNVKEEYGSVDILVNNAGITKDTLILKMKEEDFDKVLDINLKGAFNCIKNVTRIMMKQRYGKIINISSVVGLTGNAGQCNYAAAKAGLIGMTKSVAKELASRGITANVVAPGFIDTDMTKELSDKVKEGLLSNIPLNKLGKPEDIANMVAFIASEQADYITGQVLTVDGGLTM